MHEKGTMAKILALASLIAVSAHGSAQIRANDIAHEHARYRLVDIGTFGGPQGYINPWGNGGPYINLQGEVVGNTQTTVPIPANADSFLCYPGPLSIMLLCGC